MRQPRLALIRGAVLLLLITPHSRAPAQDTTRAVTPPDALPHPVACAGQRVNDIVIHSFAPTIAALRSVPVIADVVRSVHATTRRTRA